MSPEEHYEIMDELPRKMWIWPDEEELLSGYFQGRDYAWWARELGHTTSHRGCCDKCGCATTCMLDVFYDGVIASVVRELDAVGLLKELPRKEETA